MGNVNLILFCTSIESDFKHTSFLGFFKWFENIELFSHDRISINVFFFDIVDLNDCTFTLKFRNIENSFLKAYGSMISSGGFFQDSTIWVFGLRHSITNCIV
jgi:hypothetical protein